MAGFSTAGDVLAAARTAVDAVRSVTARARCVGPRGPYETDILSVRGMGMIFRQRWPERPSFNATIAGQRAWVIDEKSGEVDSLDAESVAAIQGHDFQVLALDLRAHYGTPALIGRREFAGVECYELGVTDALGHVNRAFYRVDDGRWAGMEVPDLRTPTNPPVRITIDVWRTVEGVALPAQVTAADAMGAFVFDFYALSLNDVDLALFTVPDALGRER